MKKKLLFLISIMLIITAVAGFITILSAPKQKDTLYQDDGNIHLVTTFYPVYIIALNLTDQVPRITLKNLTDMKTGCLEDYQMTTENMKVLNSAEVLMLNGGGIESFLSDTLKNYPNLPVIDLSKGITMLQEDYYDKKLIISDANTSSDISQTLN
ncbi:MAG TPA: zinc ABC transporter substrate-binding protein, partial [Mobilitalea sp.]|nr:zinc ABC transporter substrate-binding protein [Mobilitalea sp.]